MPVHAGRLDRRIVIEQRTVSQSGTGAATESWTTLAEVWAEVRPVRGRELVSGNAVQAEIDTLFTIRWRADITRQHRISHGGRLYDIEHVAEIGRQDGLEIAGKARNQ